MRQRVCLIGGVSLTVVWFAACKSSHIAVPATRPAVATQHWIQDDELQLLMKKLGRNTAAHWPNTLPDDPETIATTAERNEAFKKGAKLASDLADSAEQLREEVEKFSLSEADRIAFIGTAQALREDARKLNKASRRHNIEEMQKQLDAARASCISCHTRFKDISGTFPPRT
jgi:cytochrome c556